MLKTLQLTWKIHKEIVQEMDEFYRDDRTKCWFLTDYSNPLFITLVWYLTLSFFGPLAMRGKKPLDLRSILAVPNGLHALWSLWMCVVTFVNCFMTGISFSCQPYDDVSTPSHYSLCMIIVHFYAQQMLQIFNALLAIVHKKQNQRSFFQVYTQLSMYPLCWIIAKFYPVGHANVSIMLASGMNVLMYGYYAYTSYDPENMAVRAWKKKITLAQMLICVLIVLHQCQVFYYACDFPPLLSIYIVHVAVSYLNVLLTNYQNSKTIFIKEATRQNKNK